VAMNQEMIKRLFKAIEGDANDDIVKVAYKLIEDEKKKGHHVIAKQLRDILDENIKNHVGLKRELKSIFPSTIPLNKRHSPLATIIERDSLRHHMILSPEIEDRFRRIEQEYVGRERLFHHGLKPRQKILLYGPPGCGKSMGAERIAWNIGLPFLKVRFESIISSYLGESANNLRSIFESTASTPSVLLLDEFDFIAKSRTYGQDVGEMFRIVNMLLYLLDEYKSPGLLIATTNLEGSIDKALFRRFDEVLQIPMPSDKEIKGLLLQTFSSMKLSKAIKWESIISQMKGFSSAQVVKVAHDASKLCVINNQAFVDTHHIEHALRDVTKLENS
jgi:SpoVK/Ycf46/Vps4 family AAA+-type ATPase